MREITHLLGDVDRWPLVYFPYPKNITLTTITQYKLEYPFTISFKLQHMGNVLAEILGTQGINQVHVAETKKSAFVTFFFNGGIEKVFPSETRDEKQDLVPSYKSVPTHDKALEMSITGVVKQVRKKSVGRPKILHTTNKAPFIMANARLKGGVSQTSEDVLGDVAPTILDAIGLKHPEEMTSRSLLVKS